MGGLPHPQPLSLREREARNSGRVGTAHHLRISKSWIFINRESRTLAEVDGGQCPPYADKKLKFQRAVRSMVGGAYPTGKES